MASLGLQVLGFALAFVGWLVDIITCILPMWRVTAFIGNNIVTAQTTWEGLWMVCVVQSTGQMQCKVYDSMLALSQDLQAARALIIISILVSLLGILLAVVGGKCTTCIENKTAKARVVISAGVFFIIGGLLCLAPVSWSAHITIRDFFNPLLSDAQRRELGASLFNMAAFGLEIVGVTLSVLGWILSIVCCALPMWRVSAFIGNNIVTAQVYWEGIWMSCVVQSTGQMQCKVYDSMLALPADLQAARALVVVSIIVGILALLVSVVGAKCTNCIEDEATKARVMITSGAAFITAGVLQLIPVSWSANTVVREFYSPLIPEAMKMEIGASLYLGWAAAAMLTVGGAILCCSCPPNDKSKYPPQSRIAYSAHHSIAPASTYNKRDYV
ncbi:claudin-3 [Misgurnus anguillicaudatus]|uniref:claudin-3 n=1 Tax=Misgurnus anguillicaudatus TaxID=75329 RepID=UPI002435EE02|nr:claudin-3-like [Misgurnus anguillicaudatus]